VKGITEGLTCIRGSGVRDSNGKVALGGGRVDER
jgi:hypothetical protein